MDVAAGVEEEVQRALASGLEGRPLVELFGSLSEEAWFWANTEGLRQLPELASYLPGMPPAELQSEFTGSAGDQTLREGFEFYRLCMGLHQRFTGSPLLEALDFGCGWGRIIRFFLKDVDPNNLYGIDLSERALEACRATNRWCQFLPTNQFPPTGFEDDKFDLIYAYSVFSHLSEEAHMRWLGEFRRIASPGGLIVLTTFPREFLERLAAFEAGEVDSDPEWQRRGGIWPGAAEDRLSVYDRGEFCYSPFSEEVQHFGTTCIPEAYVRRVWSRQFQVLDYLRDPWQNVIVCQKH
jgi:SAM-dependent methyltransferase